MNEIIKQMKVIKQMKELEKNYGQVVNSMYQDNEVIHSKMDYLLLEAVDPEIKKEYLRIKEKIGFWYA